MAVFLDCFKCYGKPYIRIVEGKYVKKDDGKISNKRTTIKNLGYLEKWDDGLGDGLIQRLREQFKNKTLDIGMQYSELNLSATKDEIIIKNPKIEVNPRNIGYFLLNNIFNKIRDCRNFKPTQKS